MLLNEPLLEVTRDYLRQNLESVTEEQRSIKITNESMVPPYSGEEFINLYGSTCDNITNPVFPYIEEIYTMNIGITRRLSAVPVDHSAEAIYTIDDDLVKKAAKQSMSMRAYEIIHLIDGNYGIPKLVHQLSYLKGIVFCATSPLNYLGSTVLEEVGAEHFYGIDDNENPQALFLELRFGDFHAFFDKRESI
jgi:hypothetical protein